MLTAAEETAQGFLPCCPCRAVELERGSRAGTRWNDGGRTREDTEGTVDCCVPGAQACKVIGSMGLRKAMDWSPALFGITAMLGMLGTPAGTTAPFLGAVNCP